MCLLQKSFQENLHSWQDKFDTGIVEFWEYRAGNGGDYGLNWLNCGLRWYFGSSRIVIFYLLKSFKANNGGSITNIIEICEHPDWKKKITHLFSMHNGRNPLLNDRLFEELKDNTKAESGKVDAFLKTGSIMYSF